MTKSIMFFTSPDSAPVLGSLMKAHVSAYTRRDGAFVAEHDDKRQSKGSNLKADAKASAANMAKIKSDEDEIARLREHSARGEAKGYVDSGNHMKKATRRR